MRYALVFLMKHSLCVYVEENINTLKVIIIEVVLEMCTE
jgi:hypothetical protein